MLGLAGSACSASGKPGGVSNLIQKKKKTSENFRDSLPNEFPVNQWIWAAEGGPATSPSSHKVAGLHNCFIPIRSPPAAAAACLL
uniref:Uncharacterized protein n=1 Tax=Cyanistes caeruleus TaxID=156563 RepID=A0A8C0ZHK1_CYACU